MSKSVLLTLWCFFFAPPISSTLEDCIGSGADTCALQAPYGVVAHTAVGSEEEIFAWVDLGGILMLLVYLAWNSAAHQSAVRARWLSQLLL